MSSSYQIRQCQRPGCGLRYPVVDGQPFSEHCPRCRGETRLVLTRPLDREPIPNDLDTPQHPVGELSVSLEALLDNIRSAWNVGAMFRSADGAGFTRLHLCGITPTPEIPAVSKTALGAELSLPWDWGADGVALAQGLLQQGCRLWALEQDPRAVSIYDSKPDLPGGRLVLVVGNEVCGVDPGILELCQRVVHIPMLGAKRSLNAAVAFGIAAFALGGGR
jgi:23S rRNA (guanosine2251-2'-O)-methyltransferase